jgi:carboxylesterase
MTASISSNATTAAPSFGAAFAGPEHQPFTLNGTDGRAALLVHGFPGTPAEMRPLAQALHDRGWTTRAILLPGFGPELDTIAERRVEDWIAAVRAALNALRRDHPHVLLIGHSLGGALSLAAADARPDALILLAPFWKLDSPLWDLLPALRIIFPTFKPFRLIKFDPNDPKFREGAATFMPGVDLDDPAVQAGIRDFAIPTRLFAEIRRAGMLGAAAAQSISMPTLIIQGESDPLVKPPLTRALAARIGPAARCVETPGQHDLVDPHGAGWDAVRQHVIAFAEGVTRRAGRPVLTASE